MSKRKVLVVILICIALVGGALIGFTAGGNEPLPVPSASSTSQKDGDAYCALVEQVLFSNQTGDGTSTESYEENLAQIMELAPPAEAKLWERLLELQGESMDETISSEAASIVNELLTSLDSTCGFGL